MLGNFKNNLSHDLFGLLFIFLCRTCRSLRYRKNRWLFMLFSVLSNFVEGWKRFLYFLIEISYVDDFLERPKISPDRWNFLILYYKIFLKLYFVQWIFKCPRECLANFQFWSDLVWISDFLAIKAVTNLSTQLPIAQRFLFEFHISVSWLKNERKFLNQIKEV